MQGPSLSINYSSSPQLNRYNYIPYHFSYPQFSVDSPVPWLHEYSSIMLRESQNFYVPSINSPIKLDYSSSDSSSSSRSVTEYIHYQSSPEKTPYFYGDSSFLTVSTNSFSSFSNASSSNDSGGNSIVDTSYDQAQDYTKYTSESKVSSVPRQRACKKIRKQMLSDDAVDIMNAWFDDHVNNPYPQLEEKERMASAGKITVKQVTAWFSNRRNRTQNTKSKRMKREFDQQINSVFARIVEDKPDRQRMIDEFKNTIVSQIVNY